MPNFKLECEHRFPWDETLDIRNTTEFNYDDIDSVLMGMTDFLRGCGFVFDGQLQIVDEQEPNRVINPDMEKCGRDCESCGCDGQGERVMNWTVDQLTKEKPQDADQG